MSSIRRLAATFPPPVAMGSPEEILEVLIAVTDGFDPVDVEGGVRLLLTGAVPHFDGRFLPTATEFAKAIRLAGARRAESAARAVPPALPPPLVERDAASRERVRAMVERLAGQGAAAMRVAADDAEQKARALAGRTDARFAPSMEPDAIKGRLLRSRMNSGAVR